MSGQLIRTGLIGQPVAHSLSPIMHRAAFAALDMEGTYELWDTNPQDVETRIRAVGSEGLVGVNVTVPHKQAALATVDRIAPAAARIGAANTIILTSNGLVADNTDAWGWLASMQEAFPDRIPETAVILGAGGASRAVLVGLQDLGAKRIIIANRTPLKAQRLAEEFGTHWADWNDLPSLLPNTDLLINATALGWHDEHALDSSSIEALPRDAIAMDLTYRDTPFLRDAAACGLGVLDGLGMLIHQGARSFSLWHGVHAPVDAMRDAVVREQERRRQQS